MSDRLTRISVVSLVGCAVIFFTSFIVYSPYAQYALIPLGLSLFGLGYIATIIKIRIFRKQHYCINTPAKITIPFWVIIIFIGCMLNFSLLCLQLQDTTVKTCYTSDYCFYLRHKNMGAATLADFQIYQMRITRMISGFFLAFHALCFAMLQHGKLLSHFD